MGIIQSFRAWRGARATARALPAAWPWYAARLRLLPRDLWQLVRRETFARRLMEQTANIARDMTAPESEITAQDGHQAPKKPPRALRILLVRHGQATFNVEGRLPGQLPGVPLTDEGRRQAHRAAVALAGLRLNAIVSSPLERARETADIIARGWALPVREDSRLMDTNVGPWAGRKISEIAKDDPNWEAFLRNPNAPPEGVESLTAVQERVTAVIEELRADMALDGDVVVVAHADVIKLALARYTDVPTASALAIAVANASISALAFVEGHPPALLATNWTMAPDWLVASAPKASASDVAATETAQTAGAEPATSEPAAPASQQEKA
jgi:probable phosphoglycerate mutase